MTNKDWIQFVSPPILSYEVEEDGTELVHFVKSATEGYYLVIYEDAWQRIDIKLYHKDKIKKLYNIQL